MRVSYDVDTINELSAANGKAAAALALLSQQSLLDAVDVGLDDLIAFIASPPSLVSLRVHLGAVVLDAGHATLDSGTLAAEMYMQAVTYLSAETGLPPAVIIAKQVGVPGVETAYDLFFAPIATTEISDAAKAAGPIRYVQVEAQVGGTYEFVTGSAKVKYRIEQYAGGYRVVMTTTIYGGVGAKGAGAGIDGGIEQVIEVAWEVADVDSARRLIARVGALSPAALATALQAWTGSPTGLVSGAGIVLAGALLNVPMPADAKVTRGVAVNAEVGAVEGKATIVGGLDVDFDGGMPDLTPFGEVSFEVDAYVRYGYLDGKASVRVDPKEITLSIEGSMVLGAGVKVPGGKARAGARYEVNGELKIPISALDPRLLVRLQAGDVTAMSELYSRLDADASGHLNLYEGVEVAGGIDAEVVRAEGGVTTMEKVGSIGFGD